MGRSSKHIVGLDIGTTKVSITVAEPNEHGGLDIVGFGSCPSKGLRKGVVINLDATVDSIKSAVEEAELMAGVALEKAFVGIAGGHVRGFNSRGVVAIASKDHEITRADVARVLSAARTRRQRSTRVHTHRAEGLARCPARRTGSVSVPALRFAPK